MLEFTTLNDQALEILRNLILNGELRPGQRLDVEELSRKLGVSQTPVKDALKRLSAEGLISIVPRRGTFVTEFAREDLEELFDVRLMIELHSVEAALRNATAEDDARLRSVVEDMHDYIVDDGYTDYGAFLRLDYQLHGHVVWLAGNGRIVEIYGNIVQLNTHLVRAHAVRPVKDAWRVREEHLDIVTAFEARSVEALRAAIRRHEANRLSYLCTVLLLPEGSAPR